MERPMKPEYVKARRHLDDLMNPEYFPRTEAERRAVKTIQGQRRYTESKRRQREEANREKAL